MSVTPFVKRVLMAAGGWSLVAGHWFFVTGCWQMAFEDSRQRSKIRHFPY
jgi:hypothetical protein